MARKSSSGSFFTMALLAVGGYFAYENWPAISAWFGTIVPMPTAGPATASGTYPNSPVPTSYSTSQTFVDSAGNQWQFSTQTNQWVIATPGTAVPASAGTLVSTTPAALPSAPAAPAPGTNYVLMQPSTPAAIVLSRVRPQPSVLRAAAPVAASTASPIGIPGMRRGGGYGY